MNDDLARAFALVRLADMVGTRSVEFEHGTAVFAPDVPLRHDSNYLLVDALPEDVDAVRLAARADELQGAAGLLHRCIMFRDAVAGERLVPGFEALGWQTFRGVVMALRRAPERAVDTGRVADVAELPAELARAVAAARAADILQYPWCTPEVARQLLAARDLSPVPTRTFVVLDGGVPASWAELYVADGVGQVEAVATVERFRGRGHASAVTLHAAREAQRQGAGLVFLCADAEDWPRQLYGRLGFDEIGRYVKVTRQEPREATESELP